MKTLISIEIAVVLLKLAFGFNCTGRCCYQYHTVPKNANKCNPEGLDLELVCAVYNPQDPFTNLSVNWYRSHRKDSAGKEGDLINNTTQRYVLTTAAQSQGEVRGSREPDIIDGLYVEYFGLRIIDFAVDDNGYYWCQTVVNGTCLQPSAYGHISVTDSLTRNCTNKDYNNYHLESVPLCTHTLFSCTLKITQEPVCFTSVIFYSVIGSLVFIIVLLLLVIMTYCVSCLSHKRRQRMAIPYKDESESAALWLSRPASTDPGAPFDQEYGYDYMYPTSGDSVSTQTWSLSTVSVEEASTSF